MKMNEARLSIEERDRVIVSYIQKNPETSIRDIQKKIRIPYPTLVKRIQRLTKDGYLSRVTLVNLEKLGYKLRRRIGIQVNQIEYRKNRGAKPHSQRELAKIVQELANQKKYKDKIIIESITILLGGDDDLVVDIRAKDDTDIILILDFATEGIGKLKGVSKTRTSELAWTYREQGKKAKKMSMKKEQFTKNKERTHQLQKQISEEDRHERGKKQSL